MMEQEETEYIIKTTDRDEMIEMLRASSMQIAINCYYDEVLRKYYKYPESYKLTDDQQDFLEVIMGELREHFEHLQSDQI